MKFLVAVCVLGVAFRSASATEMVDGGQDTISESNPEKRGVELGIHSGYGEGAYIGGGYGGNPLDPGYGEGHEIRLSGGYGGGHEGGVTIATSGQERGFGSDYGGGLGFGHIESHKVEIEKPFPIPHYKAVTIPRPVRIAVPHPVVVQIPHPVPIQIPVLVPVVKSVSVPVEKKIPYPIVKPYPVKIEKTIPFPVPKPFPVPVPIVRIKHVFHAPPKDSQKSYRTYRKYYGGTYHDYH